MDPLLGYQIGLVVAVLLVAMLGVFWLKTKRKEIVRKALELDNKMDRIQVALSKAASKLEWIGLTELAEAGHQAAAAALDDLIEQLEHAVKLCKDKPTLIRALTPCACEMVNVAEDFPELLAALSKAIAKEPKLLAAVDERIEEAKAKQAEAEALKDLRAKAKAATNPTS